MSKASPERNERVTARRKAPTGHHRDEPVETERRRFDLGDALNKAFVWVFLAICVSSVVGVVFIGARH